MSNHRLSKRQPITVAQLKELFGPPPLLSTESVEAYDKVLAGLVEYYNPEDPLMAMLVKQVADETAVASRYMRHKAWAVDRRLRRRREFEVTQAKRLAERKADRAAVNAERVAKPQDEAERMFALVDVLEDTLSDVDGILNRAATEREHAWALEAAIDYIERLDGLVTAAISRRNIALRQLEAYREEFGQHLRRVSDEIIGEFREVDRSTETPPASAAHITNEVAGTTDEPSAAPTTSSPEITKMGRCLRRIRKPRHRWRRPSKPRVMRWRIERR